MLIVAFSNKIYNNNDTIAHRYAYIELRK
jgi:hypothetical protein